MYVCMSALKIFMWMNLVWLVEQVLIVFSKLTQDFYTYWINNNGDRPQTISTTSEKKKIRLTPTKSSLFLYKTHEIHDGRGPSNEACYWKPI